MDQTIYFTNNLYYKHNYTYNKTNLNLKMTFNIKRREYGILIKSIVPILIDFLNIYEKL